ncbi:cyclopropane-fatty-acyl-phospholipid synthase family protein [Conexibacter sp. CPCC 206217]|uniref:SAM-dependent methyltransferase n=1 Tax=Conexibacter sp. CPCC 206217 TaxID=3064574 RepID=UPI00271F0807|nr:cyclopropane-fatty-acyl-phospholipid synthase family protein [Conexibacter sp. CPCC 206217]MDO8214113.1 cyclopropane-fatty-acyl-phospholipid synthase family protein [Conexibacter sp. CPCC 206217]
MPFAVTKPLRQEVERAFPDRPFTIRFWDGTEVPTTNGAGPVFTIRSPRAVAHALRAPGQLGIGRAYVAGEVQVDDIDAAMDLLQQWKPAPVDGRTQARLMLAAARAVGLTRPPRRPAAEIILSGKAHSRERDAEAVRHHYDVSNDFFRLFLGDDMTYSCAIFSRGARTLQEAQETKLDLVASKLGLRAGERLLDVGCGWGSMAIHAAREYGVEVVGITLSPSQAQIARERVAAAGLSDKIDIRLQDYRDLGGEQFDAVSSIGMVEHVGDANLDEYARVLAAALKPGGRLLNHGITRLRHTDPAAGPFSERYVFPDGEPLHLSRNLLALERAGFVTQHVEGFADDYAETLRHWYENLDANLDEATRLAGEERIRVWRLYLRTARNGFRTGFIGIYQVRAQLPGEGVLPGQTPVGADGRKG